MKLLIADDEFIIRKGLLSIDWASIGIKEVYSAENGIEAKEFLTSQYFDIFISDIKMPGLDGLQLAEYVNEYSKDTLMILLTGFEEFEYAKRAITNNVFEYMIKPIRPNELLETVKCGMKVIKQKTYQKRVLKEHEDKIETFTSAEKIIYSFRDANEKVLDILYYMAHGCNENITLNDLAEEYYFTPVYLSRIIKKETGYSFSDILTAMRLINALGLLNENQYTINIICDKVGFRDQRYFSQVFKKTFGCRPSEYRENLKDIKAFTIKEILNLILKSKNRK